MKLEFSFKDVPQDVMNEHRNIDLSKNTVIYGNNGRGKTRILTAIDNLHKIASIEFQSKIFNLVEELNLSTLKIDGKDFTELSLLKNKKLESSYLTKYVKSIEFALNDLYLVLRELSGISFVFQELLSRHLDELRLLLQIAESGRGNRRQINNLIKVDRIFRTCSLTLKKLRNDIPHGFYSTTNGLADERDVFLYIRESLTINEYLLRTLEDAHYRELEENNEKVKSIKVFQKELENSLNRNDTCYISPDTNLDVIMNKIDENIKKNIEKYGFTFFEKEDIVKITRESITNKIKEIQDNIIIANKLLSTGYGGLEILIQSGRIKVKKNSGVIDCEKLSSGEKRIIKLFLSVLFEKANIYLIDEPEVSLSLNFQSKLINDLVYLCERKGSRIILATHAPYVFKDCIANDFERLEL
ncbi:AAA family ATPase [uncultured Streptococcus sp.]|uniref:AAA family ATPase n=1 Tax=uncultured Streptococcus sp. TaxID=83427 RepID=UPI001A563FDB|nr:AAA family ATPase [uncultured Streptococcus sp.]VTY13742.1 AAA domain protein [uncultured Streptococcus sp.]